MKILLLSDIHGNYPALAAVDNCFAGSNFDYIVNSGDSTVYAPFPNEVLNWLRRNQAISILGNTDRKVIKLLTGKNFKKPSNHEKRVMYEATAAQLSATNANYLRSLPEYRQLSLNRPTASGHSDSVMLGLYHGSPAKPNEFLFDSTPDSRFLELAAEIDDQIVVTGHSHSPYHKIFEGVHYINPGSVGRMFDGNPAASCAILHLHDSEAKAQVKPRQTAALTKKQNLTVSHYRIEYDISLTNNEIRRLGLPSIYERMYSLGKKLN